MGELADGLSQRVNGMENQLSLYVGMVREREREILNHTAGLLGLSSQMS